MSHKRYFSQIKEMFQNQITNQNNSLNTTAVHGNPRSRNSIQSSLLTVDVQKRNLKQLGLSLNNFNNDSVADQQSLLNTIFLQQENSNCQMPHQTSIENKISNNKSNVRKVQLSINNNNSRDSSNNSNRILSQENKSPIEQLKQRTRESSQEDIHTTLNKSCSSTNAKYISLITSYNSDSSSFIKIRPDSCSQGGIQMMLSTSQDSKQISNSQQNNIHEKDFNRVYIDNLLLEQQFLEEDNKYLKNKLTEKSIQSEKLNNQIKNLLQQRSQILMQIQENQPIGERIQHLNERVINSLEQTQQKPNQASIIHLKENNYYKRKTTKFNRKKKITFIFPTSFFNQANQQEQFNSPNQRLFQDVTDHDYNYSSTKNKPKSGSKNDSKQFNFFSSNIIDSLINLRKDMEQSIEIEIQKIFQQDVKRINLLLNGEDKTAEDKDIKIAAMEKYVLGLLAENNQLNNYLIQLFQRMDELQYKPNLEQDLILQNIGNGTITTDRSECLRC